jgi:uncharacterized protein
MTTGESVMKSAIKIIGILIILGAALPACAADSSLRTLTVRGEAFVEIDPDFVEMTFGLMETNDSAARAKENVDQRINAVIAALQKFSIGNDDIAMSGVEVNRTYKNDRNDNQEVDGYEVLRYVTIKLRNIVDYEALSAELVLAGVGELGEIKSGLDDEAQLKRTALEAAARDARVRAEAITNGLGVGLGAPIEVGENQLRPVTRFEQSNASEEQIEEITVTASSIRAELPPLFVPGKIRMSGVVWVVFALQSE